MAKVWDPAGSYDEAKAKAALAKLESEIEVLRDNPGKPKSDLKKILLYSSAIALFLIPSAIFLRIPELFYYPGLIILFIGFYTLHRYKVLARKYIKLQFMRSADWVFYPGPEPNRGLQMKKAFPELFDRGDEQYFEDQFWGTSGEIPLHGGIFHHITYQKGAKVSNTKKVEYYWHYAAFRIKTKNHRFLLSPESTFLKLRNLFSDKEINTESIEFNKEFAFSYPGSKEEKGMHIMKALSPAVQLRLLELKRKRGEFWVLFAPDCIIFMMKGKLIENYSTNLFKDIEVSQQDIDTVSYFFNDLVSIAKDIVRHLD